MSIQPNFCHRQDLLTACDALLEPQLFRDYAPNGLQVEGKEQIQRLVTGVTASRALIEAAIEQKADAILVHHGLFWRGMDGRVTGWLKERLRLLLAHDISLFAYHLPLDAHSTLGNNAQLALRFGVEEVQGSFGDQNLGLIGSCHFDNAQALLERVQASLGRSALMVGGGEINEDLPIKRLAWCSGGAQSYFEAAIQAGAQAFVTGEISEPQTHLARESGVIFIAAGHHASERYGVQALGQELEQRLGIEHLFIDIDNPA